MLNLAPATTRADNLIFVFWGTHFEEAAAAIFATKLRQAGLCVKLVGLAGQRPSGRNGLALYPDISLGEALAMAEKAVCVILPCSAATLKQAETDPRVADFYRKSQSNGAHFVVSTADTVQKTRLGKMLIPCESVSIYEGASNLIAFADDLAASLANLYGV